MLLCCVSQFISLFFFFFSSRRRHTRSLRDWSSDVCSSDLGAELARRDVPRRVRGARRAPRQRMDGRDVAQAARRSEERRVGKSVDLGGRRIIKKKKNRRKRG